jgi:CHASE2 domain-containing sensor protein
MPELREHARLAHINLRYNAAGHVWSLPYALTFGGKPYPSFASEMAGISGPVGESFPLDYAIDPRSVPVVSAVDAIEGRVSEKQIRGKTVIIGTTSLDLGDVPVPGLLKLAGVYSMSLAQRRLRRGSPARPVGFYPYLLALFVPSSAQRAKRDDCRVSIFAGSACAFLSLPLALEAQRIWVHVVPALFLLLTVGGSLAWSNFRQSTRARAQPIRSPASPISTFCAAVRSA